MVDAVNELKGSNHRVLFQNAEGNINAGVFFNDPDIEFEDISWYNCIADQMLRSMERNENLVYLDDEFGTQSCYVELHRYRL